MRIITMFLLILAATLVVDAQPADFMRQLPGPAGPRTYTLSGPFGDGTIGATVSGEVGGIYCSADTGRSFSRCGGARVENVLFSNAYYENTYVVESRSGSRFMTNGLELFRSDDAGQSWSALSGFREGTVHFHIGGVTSLYDLISDTAGRTAIVRTTDEGATWQRVVSEEVPVNVDFYPLASGAVLIAVEDTLYRMRDEDAVPRKLGYREWKGPLFVSIGLLLIHIDYRTGDVVRSTDEGQSWQTSGNVIAPGGGELLVARAHADGRVIVAADNNALYTTSDSGRTWRQIHSLPEPVMPPIGYETSLVWSGRTILVGRRRQLIRSTDDGATWSEILTGETAGSRITATLLLPDGSLGATDGTSGLFFRTTDHGESWRTLGRIGTTQGEYAKAFALNRRGDLLAGTFLSSGANIYISRDGGTTWEPRLDSGTTMGIYEIAMAGGDTMFAATYYDGVLRSIDQGESWSRVGEGRLPVEVAMALCIASDGSIFVGGPEGIWWSSDGGDTWSSRTNGLPTRFVPIIYGLNWMPDGTLLASTHGEMFRSSDYGLTWSASDRPPGRGGASTDEFAPTVVAAPDGVLYCSTVNGNAFSGVYRSTDDGDTWSLVSTYPHRASMWSLTLDREGYLYAATFGAGLWRSSSVSGVPGDRELPGELMLSRNW